MDQEQEKIQFLGVFGILVKSYKIIISYIKIFAQITLSLILPLTFIFLALLEISDLLFGEITHIEFKQELTSRNTKRYNNLSDMLSSEWIAFWLFKTGYITIFVILSLLSSVVVVYTIATVYTRHELSVRKVMSFVSKFWKTLMITFFFLFVAFFLYIFLALLVMIICLFIVPYPLELRILLFIVLIIYVMGIVYMTIIWQLASVILVIESSYGQKAMTKSKDMIKGNRVVVIFFLLNVSIIQFSFESLVVHGSSLEIWKRLGFGVLCLLLLSIVFLFGYVIQTILYLVSKSYHQENIDKGDLSDRLESYLGEDELLSGKDVQLEQYNV